MSPEKSQEYFCVKWGLLFYSKVPKIRAVGCKGRVDREWRQVPRTVQQQEQIVWACHSSVDGRQESLILQAYKIKCHFYTCRRSFGSRQDLS